MKHPSDDKHFHQLLQRSFEGRLSDAETAELRELLSQSPEAMDHYLEHCQMEAWLSDPAFRTEPEAGKVTSLTADPPATQESTRDSRRSFRQWGGWAVAAIVCVAAAGLWVAASGRNSDEAHVARVIRIEGGGQTSEGRVLAVGDRLRAGEKLTIEQGLIEFAFRDSGVHVVATAPLSFVANSTERMFLHEGEVKLHVPPQGVGFVVETLENRITDLGTSFVVTTREQGSKVLVLDGEIMVDSIGGGAEQLMIEGDHADIERGGAMNLRSRKHAGVPELSLPSMHLSESSLAGSIFAFDEGARLSKKRQSEDLIGRKFLPLIQSGFRDRSSLQKLIHGAPIRFTGVAGVYSHYPERTGLRSYHADGGWLAWYQGTVKPPQKGRYRFWGYADNQLLVAVDGEAVFEGSRYDSVLREDLDVPRRDHPAWPCLNSGSGFASGQWIEVGDDPVQIDILFGETGGNLTSALLLIEREGETYEETFWGQPKWPLFLTGTPAAAEIVELENLRRHMEEKLMGSFSIPTQSTWSVVTSN